MTRISEAGRLPWWIAVPTAALGGWLFDLANPDIACWPLVFPAILLILASWWKQQVGVAVLAGVAAGAAFWMPHISWLTLYLGPIPWLALSAVMIAWFALQGLVTAVATRGIAALPSMRRSPVVMVLAQSAAAAGIWVLREGVQGSWPYGGFPWGRVAHVFADTPFGALVSWVGFAGLSGFIVLCCAAITGGVLSMGAGWISERQPSVPVSWHVLVPGAIAVALVGASALVAPAQLAETGMLRVAAVQGNSKSGIFDDRESGDVFADHIAATEQLLDDLEAENEQVDVIVWPENAGEFGLTANPLRGREVALLAKRAGAQIVVGTVLQDDDGTYTNSSIVWGPDGQQRPTETSRYDKRFPVPFAEYMPNRDFFHALVPDLVDLVQLEYRTGTTPPVMPVQIDSATIRAGVAICFDIIFDDQAVHMTEDDAEVIFAQSNNADFGRTDESVQQLQIARLRAIETGRALVNISTVGTSAIIAPDGGDIVALPTHTQGSLVADVPLVTGETPALRFGAFISTIWMIIGGAGFAAGSVALLRIRRSTSRAEQLEALVE